MRRELTPQQLVRSVLERFGRQEWRFIRIYFGDQLVSRLRVCERTGQRYCTRTARHTVEKARSRLARCSSLRRGPPSLALLLRRQPLRPTCAPNPSPIADVRVVLNVIAGFSRCAPVVDGASQLVDVPRSVAFRCERMQHTHNQYEVSCRLDGSERAIRF